MPLNFVRMFPPLLLVVVGSQVDSASLAAEPPTRETLQALSPDEKTALFQKKERFDALPATEQATR